MTSFLIDIHVFFLRIQIERASTNKKKLRISFLRRNKILKIINNNVVQKCHLNEQSLT